MKNFLILASIGFSLCFGATAFAQGPLTPSGPPAATMKSLDQIEPRTPVDAVHTPGDANNIFVINQPGSYYLTTNLIATDSRRGIFITTNSVTLDLNGFSIIGNGSGAYGIYETDYALHGLTVRNGAVRDWHFVGILNQGTLGHFDNLTVENGANSFFTGGYATEFNHCAASGFSSFGFELSSGSVLRNCSSYDSLQTGSIGFFYNDGCTFTACLAQGCDAGFLNFTNGGVTGSSFTDCQATGNRNGFVVSSYSALTQCTVSACTSNGIISAPAGGCKITDCTIGGCTTGINAGPNTTITSCTVSSNYNNGIVTSSNTTLNACTSSGNAGNGLITGNNNTINTCTTSGNSGTGIVAGLNNTLTGCTASGNLLGGITAAANCTLTGCTMNQNGGLSPNAIGLSTDFRATVVNCSADQNQNDGIRVNGDSTVTGSHASFNGRGTVSAGIRATGGGSRIDGNQTRDNNGYGIFTTGFDIVTRNFSGGSATNYFPATAVGGLIAPILTPATATNALANF